MDIKKFKTDLLCNVSLNLSIRSSTSILDESNTIFYNSSTMIHKLFQKGVLNTNQSQNVAQFFRPNLANKLMSNFQVYATEFKINGWHGVVIHFILNTIRCWMYCTYRKLGVQQQCLTVTSKSLIYLLLAQIKNPLCCKKIITRKRIANEKNFKSSTETFPLATQSNSMELNNQVK